jgi:hypothetical protein
MDQAPASTKLSFWKVYLRAVVLMFLTLLALDWLAYSAFEQWLAWPFLIPVALAGPAVMTAIT